MNRSLRCACPLGLRFGRDDIFPVFANGAFGLATLIGPTGGYLLGFIPAAFVMGFLGEKG